jgi:hypothetical protein
VTIHSAPSSRLALIDYVGLLTVPTWLRNLLVVRNAVACILADVVSSRVTAMIIEYSRRRLFHSYIMSNHNLGLSQFSSPRLGHDRGALLSLMGSLLFSIVTRICHG